MSKNLGRVLTSTLIVLGVLVIPIDFAAASDNFVTLPDVHGPDDASGQSDLVSALIDSSHLGDADPTLFIQWAWDEVNLPGNNTGDACAMFDTTGDGLVNNALCVTITGSPAIQHPNSPQLYECTANNLSTTRCNGDTLLTGTSSTCAVSTVGTDTVATCEVDMDDVGGGTASIVNTCSFNSAEPNSNPPDCILEPGMGILVVKDVTDDAAITSDFEVVIDGVGTTPFFIVGDGTYFLALPPGTHSIAETAIPAGYALDSSSCTSGTPDSFTLTIGGTESVTCTFVNGPATPSSIITKTFDAASVDAGSSGQTLSISVLNDGGLPLDNVLVSDLVDPLLTVTIVASDLGGDCSTTVGNDVSCLIPTVGVGETATITVTFAVDETVEPTSITNTATVVSDQLPTPDSASAALIITEDVALSVAKTFAADPVAGGTNNNTFTIAVTNNGLSDAENVAITDIVDPTLSVTGVSIDSPGTCVGSSGQLVDCLVPDLAAGQTATVTVTYDVDVSVEPISVANTASAVSDEVTIPVEASTSVDVVENVDLAITKIFTTDPVSAGTGDQTFAISVTNNGTSDAENVIINDVVDPSLLVTLVTSTTADCSASAGQSVVCSLARLAPGQTINVLVTYDVGESTDPALISNTASVVSDEIATPVGATTTVDLVEDVVFDLVKSFDSATAVAGSTSNSFTIELSNTGTSDAENVTVSDLVDPALTVSSIASATMDCLPSVGQSVECLIPVLAANETVSLTVFYAVDQSIGPAIVTNTASATSDEITTPVVANASVEMVEDVVLTAGKTFSPASAPAGSTGNQFTMTVTNNGLSDADNVRITDLVDPTLAVISVDIAPAGDCSASVGQFVDCTILSLESGQTATVTVTYDIDSGAVLGPVTNSLDVVSDEDSTSASASVDVIADVEFVVTKAFDSATVAAGTTGHTFTVSVTNSGPSDATGVTIVDEVDPALVVTSVTSATADCLASAGQSVDCSLAALAAGVTATVVVTYDVPESIDTSTVSNVATVDSNELAVPEQATAEVAVVEDVQLLMSKTFSSTVVTAGATGESFTLAVTNNGSSDADNVAVFDLVDPTLTVSSVVSGTADCSVSSGQLIDCSLLTLGAGASTTVVVTFDVASDIEPTTITNLAVTTSDEVTTPQQAEASVDIVEDVVLGATKLFDPNPASAGTSGNTITVVVTNSGQSEADGVRVVDVVDPRLVVTGTTTTIGDCSASLGNNVDCVADTLASGASMIVEITYDLDESVDPLTVANTAQITSDEVQTPVPATDTLVVQEDVALSLIKSFSPDPAVVGSAANTFSIVVTNEGLSDAENVTVNDVVDPTLVVTAVTNDSGAVCDPPSQSIFCRLPTLAAGASMTVTVSYRIDAAQAAGAVTNSATATSDEVVDPVEAVAQVDIIRDVQLSATKQFVTDPVTAGAIGNTFTISVTNDGSSDSDPVSIADLVSANLTVTNVAVSRSGDCAASLGNSIACLVDTVPANSTVTVTVTYDIDPAVTITSLDNTAIVDSGTLPAPLQPSATVTINQDVVLEPAKTFATDTVTAGLDGYAVTLAVTNSGISTADNVVFTDLFPAELTVASISPTAGGDCSASVGQTISCVFATVAPGSTASVVVIFDLASDVAVDQTITNLMSVTSDELIGTVGTADTVDVVAEADVTAEKTFAGDPVVAGTTGNSFTIEVANAGPSDVNDVSVTDMVDARLVVTAVSVAPLGDCGVSLGQTVDCAIGTVRAGESTVVTVTFDVAADVDATTAPIVNTASVTGSTLSQPLQPTAEASVVREADLAVSKTSTPDPVIAGEPITFTITVVNNGPSVVDELVVSEQMPPELIGPVFTPSAGSYDPTTGVWTGLTMALGDEVTLQIVADTPPDLAGSVVNVVDVQPGGDVTDPDPSDNEATVQNESEILTDVEVAISISTETPIPGQPIQYVIELTNNGPGTALDGILVDQLSGVVDDAVWTCEATGSPGTTCASAAGSGDVNVSFDLVPGDTIIVIVDGIVPPGITGDDLVNVAAATVDGDSTTVNNTSTATYPLQREADLGVKKTANDASDGQFSAGDELVYALTVTNTGPSAAPNVVVVDTLPAGTVFKAATAGRGTCTHVTGLVECTVNWLAVDETMSISITVEVAESAAGSELVNRVSASSEADDPDTTNNSAQASVTVPAEQPPLAVTGSSTLILVAVGMMYLIAGWGALVVGRRETAT